MEPFFTDDALREKLKHKLLFVSEKDPKTECLLYGKQKGYVTVRVKNKFHDAHRLIWMVTYNQPIPADRVVIHSCDIPNCVNINHLLLGTSAHNKADMFFKGGKNVNKERPLPPFLKERIYMDYMVGVIKTKLALDFNLDAGRIRKIIKEVEEDRKKRGVRNPFVGAFIRKNFPKIK